MTDREPLDLSRRRVLKRTALATGVAAVGVGGFSGTAVASDCPRTPGFWGTHDWCTVDTNPSDDEPVPEDSVAEAIGLDCPDPTGEYCLDGTGVCMTMDEWMDLLLANTRGDKSHIMAKHLLATTLNFWRRPIDDPSCTDREVDFSAYGLDQTTTIIDVRGQAADWLAATSFPDGQQRHWMADGVDGEPLKNVLDAFNNGTLDTLDCDCPAEE